MRKSILFLAVMIAGVLLFVGCQPANSNNANKPANTANNSANSNTASSAATEEDIKKLMTELAAGLAKNDPEAVGKYYSDDYVLVTPQGVAQTKAERLADMKSGNTKFESFAYEDIKVRTFGDTAVAIATVSAKGKTSGNEAAPHMKATLVFHKTPEGWKVVSGQATAVAATPSTASNTASNSNANSSANANSHSNANSANAAK